jgi:hypothetical protein
MSIRELIKTLPVRRRGSMRTIGLQVSAVQHMPPAWIDLPEAETEMESVLRQGLDEKIYGDLREKLSHIVFRSHYHDITPEARAALLALFEP